MDSFGGIPKTPTRPKRTSGSGTYTPKSATTPYSQRHVRPGKLVRTPRRSPFNDMDNSREASPEFFNDGQHRLSGSIFDSSSVQESPATPQTLPGLSLFLPTPSTVGTGRKPRHESPFTRKSGKSRPLIEQFQALADAPKHEELKHETTAETKAETNEHTEFRLLESLGPELNEKGSSKPFVFNQDRTDSDTSSDLETYGLKLCSSDLHDPKNTPSTPIRNPIIEQKPCFDSFPEYEESVSIVRVKDVDNLPRYELPNPFIDHGSPKEQSETCEKVDFSTHMEMVNNRTGERKIEVLSQEQLRFKPRKLDFTSAVSSPEALVSPQTPQTSMLPKPDDYKIANKYVESSIGKNFVMGVTRPKGSLDFEIFADE